MTIFLENTNWKTLLLGQDNWGFLLETALRSFIMFIVILLGLRLLGKRGIKQLSVFELGVIIGLGSAAGDPMFYKDVGLLPGITVFCIVIGLYRMITFIINHNSRFEAFIEGEPTCIVDKGRLLISNFKKESIALDEFFSQLRLNSVSHLGQIQYAILETNGDSSIFYYPDEEVKYGLPIIPKLCKHRLQAIIIEGYYACTFCGNTQKLEPAPLHICTVCSGKEWLKAINTKRVS